MSENERPMMHGTVAEEMRVIKVEHQEFPICILLENVTLRKAMSGAMTPQQAYEMGQTLIKAANELGGVERGRTS